MDAIRDARLNLCADPLGGAGLAYWARIAERYGLHLTIQNDHPDPTFRFMSVDWDGKIRMDCSSPYAMAGLIALKDKYDLAFACDTDHDRHGIVTRSAGLMNPNHYLAAAISYLFANRPGWRAGCGRRQDAGLQQHDRSRRGAPGPAAGGSAGRLQVVCRRPARRLARFRRRRERRRRPSCGATDTVWTTDKDGIIMGLLAAEMMARTGKDPGEIYRALTEQFGAPVYQRIDAPATAGAEGPAREALARTGQRQRNWPATPSKRC